ncbi:TPA: lytic transglycosylase domain-containing protein [Neisseria meningitidis]|uniref:lytic transglycosylase domain-containing protein n=1 Tax=Neisseria meningitidis TaxID=487 RepID=UPI00038B5DB7|nr:lytic transglycosylase domain-containing protein [Neisseria meningitidis]EQD18273.1 transglycosylase SLT domain protein [Neisseria meningitidis NM3173]CWN75684.1 type IV secretion system lytic transglycosylase VirB1 [Neisseria meningitidis]CWR64969.1 type IV secretion system lytic transglycosylase VirB1 [Neisseria meningitidis]
MHTAHFLIMTATIATALPTFAEPPPPINYSQMRFNDLAQQCSKGVHPNTLQAVARVESRFNPYVIGVVRGSLKRQPTNLAEAIATAKSLHAQGKNFSMGLMQVNRYNLAAYGLNYETVFDPCQNINVGAQILKDCFDRAGGNGQEALKKAFSCYYSGNFRFGFRSDFKGQPPYVTKIILAAMDNSPYQTIRFSGSLKTSGRHSEQSSLLRTNYVPQPSNSRQPETYSAPLAEQQVVRPNSVTEKPVSVSPAETQTVAKATAAWDVFADF